MSTQTLIPFPAPVASREQVRQHSQFTDGLRKVHIDNVRLRPGLNARRQGALTDEQYDIALQIPELANGIYESNGNYPPILGDITADGVFYQTDGERRIRAIRMLIAQGFETYPNGKRICDVKVLLNPPDTTDLDRMVMVVSSQDNMKLKPMERAYHYLRLKKEFSLTDEQIAKRMKVSRQTVNNYIMATELPQDVQNAVDADVLKISVALAEHRKEKHPEKEVRTVTVNEETGEVIISGTINGAEDIDFFGKIMSEDESPVSPDGDEDEFAQEDNSVTFPGSKSGPKEDASSGAHTVGADSPYMQKKKKSIFEQFFNRYGVLYENATKLIVADKPSDEEDPERAKILHDKRQDRAIENLMKEFEITVR